MKALPNDKWRQAAIHYAFGSGRHGAKIDAVRKAGYEGTDNALYVLATRMFQDHRMLAAIVELTKGEVKALLPAAKRAMTEIINDPGHKDRFAASKTVLDRAGVAEAAEVNVNHTHSLDEQTLARVAALGKRMGFDPTKMLGWRHGQIIDVTPEPVAIENHSQLTPEEQLKRMFQESQS